MSYVKNRYKFAKFITELVTLAVKAVEQVVILIFLCQYFLLTILVLPQYYSKIRTGDSIYKSSFFSQLVNMIQDN